MTIALNLILPPCSPTPSPAPIYLPNALCVPTDEVKASEIKTGSRTLLVTPYSTPIASGQYGQWQNLIGLGGQINRGFYVGSSIGKIPGYANPGIATTVDHSDTVSPGTKCIAIRDRGRWYVYCPKGSAAGTSASPALVGALLGGNISPIEVDPAATDTNTDTAKDEQGYTDAQYPADRPFSYPMAYLNHTGYLYEYPRVKDWSKYVLPVAYAVGNKLPRISDGLCYVQLQRPYTWQSQAWDAGQNAAPVIPTPNPTQPFAFLASRCFTPYTICTAFWTQTIYYKNGAIWAPSFTITDPAVVSKFVVTVTNIDGTMAATAALTQVQVGPPGYPNALSFYFNRAFDPAIENVSVAIPGAMLGNHDGSVLLTTPSVSLVFGIVQRSVAIAINRTGKQAFGFGDYVLMVDNQFSLVDEKGRAQPVLEIISALNPPQGPHAHLNFGGGPTGGGRIFGAAGPPWR